MSRKLVVSDGSRERELVLVGRLVVGRDPVCDITYDDALLSRRHAEFVTAGDQVTVRDLGSRNGVFVNGAKIAERSLRSGDVVQIGPVRARYVADDLPVSIAPDEVDADHTAVIHHARPVPAPAAIPAAPTPATPPPAQDQDDDRTLIVPAPRAQQTRDSAVRPALAPASAVDDDEERTQLLKAPAPSPQPQPAVQPRPVPSSQPPIVGAKATAPVAPAGSNPAASALRSAEPVAPRSAAAAQQSAPDALRNPLSTYVFVQVLVLAVIVLVAAAVPLFMGRGDRAASAPLVWLALPVGVALIAAYWVSVQINRRIGHALAAVEQTRQ